MTAHVFCGPTLSRAEVLAELPAAVVHRPIRHGDALRLDVGPGDLVLIIDGVFHQSASVRHKEILVLIAAGAIVVGCSSMGALRAAELDVYGMVGVGEIYRMYKEGVTDADADVAVTHTEGAEVEQLSVAMVDLESQLLDAQRAGAVDDTERTAIAAVLRNVHYTERRPRHLGVLDAPGMAAFRSWLAANPDARGAKRRDALAALRLAAQGAFVPAEPGTWLEEEWRTEYLAGWQDRHAGTDHDGRHISLLAQSQYRQIFDADYPRRWRDLVLTWIGDAAADSGLRLEDLTTEQRRHWLTAAEDSSLDEAEAMARILVRSAGSGAVLPGRDLPPAEPDAAVLEGVARAFAVNDRAATHGVSVHQLDDSAVREFLRQLWRLDEAPEEACDAAARDRGFRSFEGAVGVCRQFILAELGEGLWRHLGEAPVAG
ncbi:TfuA-like protein [Glycomyces dulcitolivorans]|uniref:TfuA-like protein n=1 Tax=Glycomyces dulcitolivorans TaxID=2200759 RepID=UPI000DD4625A|nr:TfuA-like protein [Glycomyces dulcitolivorans]